MHFLDRLALCCLFATGLFLWLCVVAFLMGDFCNFFDVLK